MASILPIRAARTVSCSACRSFINPASAPSLLPRRGISTTSPRSEAEEQSVEENSENTPRWAQTPPRAKAPFSLRLHSKRPGFFVNHDPLRLDQFYIGMLGDGGHKVLSEEVKWLAITHKSFDQGRRGFNDRLAFLGKRIVQLQTSLALVQNVTQSEVTTAVVDEFGRKPFTHRALDGLSNLSDKSKTQYIDKSKLATLARRYQLHKVIRWSPRKPNDLAASGIDLVLAHTMYSIIGAISLEKGGHVANKVAQKRILIPLGLHAP